MKYYYGKHHWKTLEQGEEHCYLMTNSLGGFSSQSIIGSCSRNDQALLMACTHSPNCRYNMIHRLDEQVQTENRIYILSSQDFQNHQKAQQGYQYLSNFTFEHYPQWSYLLPSRNTKNRHLGRRKKYHRNFLLHRQPLYIFPYFTGKASHAVCSQRRTGAI